MIKHAGSIDFGTKKLLGNGGYADRQEESRSELR